MKLMIVDDHAEMRNRIREAVVYPESSDVCECASGLEAIQEASRFQPDIVTMDVSMPGLNGYEATRALLNAYPSARVIIVTLFPTETTKQLAVSCGAIGFVSKENLDELRALLFEADDASDTGRRAAVAAK